MKVIVTLASLAASTGGPPRSVSGLCDALVGEGVDVVLVSANLERYLGPPVLPRDDRVKVRTCRVNVYSQRLTFLWAPQYRNVLSQELKGSSHCVLHDNGMWLPTNVTASSLAASSGTPLVISLRGMGTQWALNSGRIKKRVCLALYQRKALSRAQCIHATSDAELAEARQLGTNSPTAVIPNGVVLPSLFQSKKRGKSKRVVLCLSRFSPVKGLIPLVRAWAQVCPNGWTLRLSGPDDRGHRYAVERSIRESNIPASSITVTGEVDERDKGRLYKDADLLVLPSFSENFGIVVAEALAHGVPVIAGKGTPWKELSRSGCGWWVDSTEGELATALMEATSLSDAEREVMGREGRSLIARQFSWKSIAARFIEVYEWMLGSRGTPESVFLQ